MQNGRDLAPLMLGLLLLMLGCGTLGPGLVLALEHTEVTLDVHLMTFGLVFGGGLFLTILGAVIVHVELAAPVA